jgi:7,8-dihydropterin-6-yl-methyl-4-(beta-D-ribofuranosyl)aminobenzene 5'-phosphate synthase
MNTQQPLQMTIVYDNNALGKNLRADWGFSCFIQGLEKSILFDTGTDGKILLSNMDKLGIRPEYVNLALLSHEHKDHTGGLKALLAENSNIEVWIPEYFSSSFKNMVKKEGASVKEVSGFQKICSRAYTTGIVEGWIREQSLILETEKGLVVVTGCAHPRIVKIIATVRELMKKNIHLVFGGFHLSAFEKNEIKDIIEKFRESGVEKAGPCHCTGDEARRLFAEEYKEDFVEIGVGKEIRVQ